MIVMVIGLQKHSSSAILAQFAFKCILKAYRFCLLFCKKVRGQNLYFVYPPNPPAMKKISQAEKKKKDKLAEKCKIILPILPSTYIYIINQQFRTGKMIKFHLTPSYLILPENHLTCSYIILPVLIYYNSISYKLSGKMVR